MSAVLDRIAKEALRLPAAQRAQLADALVESLEAGELGEIEGAWVQEAQRRRDEIRSGQVEPVPAEDVVAEARRLTRR